MSEAVVLSILFHVVYAFVTAYFSIQASPSTQPIYDVSFGSLPDRDTLTRKIVDASPAPDQAARALENYDNISYWRSIYKPLLEKYNSAKDSYASVVLIIISFGVVSYGHAVKSSVIAFIVAFVIAIIWCSNHFRASNKKAQDPVPMPGPYASFDYYAQYLQAEFSRLRDYIPYNIDTINLALRQSRNSTCVVIACYVLYLVIFRFH